MAENTDPMAKENIPQIVTPTRSKPGASNGLNSPAQTKSLWDSSDPLRNPPPLPLSPQMLRTTTNSKNKGSASSSPVGKLQFTAVDTSEIEFQLQRVHEAQNSLKTLLQSIDLSVKQTHMEIENLNQRSSNNNTRLKDLLENVSAVSSAAKNTITSSQGPSLSIDDVQTVVSKSEAVLSEKIAMVEALKKEIADGLEKVMSTASTQQDPQLMKEISDIKEQLSSLHSKDNSTDLSTITKSIDTHAESQQKLKDLVSSTQEQLMGSLKEIHNTLGTLKINDHISSLKESHRDLETGVRAHLEKMSNSEVVTEITEKLQESMAPIVEQLTSLKSESDKLVAGDKSLEVLDKFDTLEMTLKSLLSSVTGDLSDLVISQLSQVHESQKTALEKSSAMETSTQQLNDQLTSQLKSISESVQLLAAKVDTQSTQRESTELEQKDKEIVELRAQLEEERKKQTISQSILELTEQKAKLEGRLEGLQEVYQSRYQDLKSLAREHEELNAKLLESNTDKLKSIAGAVAFAQMTLDDSKSSTSTPRASKNGNSRVLSTNSYLNRRSTLSPKRTPKRYTLAPIDGEDDSEKENVDA